MSAEEALGKLLSKAEKLAVALEVLRQSLGHERDRRQRALGESRRQMRPLWDRHLRLHAA